MMQKLIILIFIIFYISPVGFTQNLITVPLSGSLVIEDSSHINLNSYGKNNDLNDSILKIFWNTKSIIGGWTKCNPLLDSAGSLVCDSTAPFIMPVTGKLLRGYSSYHAGWDIGLKAGTPVRAALGGKVRYAQYCSGYGNLAIIRHTSGLEIYYSHLSKLNVTPNQYVEAGDTIGLVGSSGHATTPHLHLEFRIFDDHFDISKIYTQNDSIIYLWKMNQTSLNEPVAQNTSNHTVVRGETLTKIAKHYGTSVANLLKINNLKYNSILRIGQKIRIY
jgi:murein DD-endopeptidase MepM/ murein hydrolase activator NlpD